MTGRASRDRGARAERAVVNHLRAHGFPGARRHHGADGRAPGDIFGVPGVTIEVKDRTQSSWPSWRAQLLDECPPGDVAVLVRRVRGVTDVGAWDAEMLLPDSITDLVRGLPLEALHQCSRTNKWWVRVPFGVIVELLEGQNCE